MKKFVLLVAVMMSVVAVTSAKSVIGSEDQQEVVPTMKTELAQRGGAGTIPPIIIR